MIGMIGMRSMKSTIPICWKCTDGKMEAAPSKNSGVEFISGTGKIFHFIGCKAESRIKNYKDAEKLCPLLSKDLNLKTKTTET